MKFDQLSELSSGFSQIDILLNLSHSSLWKTPGKDLEGFIYSASTSSSSHFVDALNSVQIQFPEGFFPVTPTYASSIHLDLTTDTNALLPKSILCVASPKIEVGKVAGAEIWKRKRGGFCVGKSSDGRKKGGVANLNYVVAMDTVLDYEFDTNALKPKSEPKAQCFFVTIGGSPISSKFGAFPVFVVDGSPSHLKSQARTARFFRSSGIG